MNRILWLAVVAVVATGCAGKPPREAGPAPKSEARSEAPCAPGGTELEVVALHYERGELPTFDADCLAAPAGQAFTIELTNDDLLEHNVSIYAEPGASYSEALFHGELFRGPGETRTYEVPAMDAGTYEFRCDEHLSTMKGVFVVA